MSPPPSPRDALEAALREVPNPFADTVLRSGHEPPAFDVPTVQAKVSRRIDAALAAVRADGRSRLLVVSGDPGEGKTHLLGRLRHRAEQSLRTPEPFALAIVRPLRDPREPFAHVLREAAASLDRPLASFHDPAVDLDPDGDPPASQLERMGWLAIGHAVEHLAPALPSLEPLRVGDLQRSLATFAAGLRHAWPAVGADVLARGAPWAERLGIDLDVWRVVCRLPVEGARHAALAWLKGSGLGEADLARFGLPPPIAGEDRAYRVLTSLGNLAGAPLVLGFDQIEGIRRQGRDEVRQFFAALGELHNHEPGNLLLLVFSQTTLWPDMAQDLEQQLLDRIGATALFEPVGPDEVLALCEQRLAALWRGLDLVPASPLDPFTPAEVAAATAGLTSPRRVLNRLHDLFEARRGAPPAPEKPRARRLYEEALAREAREVAAQTPDARAAMSRSAVQRALDGARRAKRALRGGATVEELREVPNQAQAGSGLLATIARGGERRRVYVEANGSAHGNSTAATLKRLRRQVEGPSAPADVALLLREQGQPLPAASADLIERASRVSVVWLEDGDLPALAALEDFLNQAADNEIPEPDAAAFSADVAAELGAVDKLIGAVFDPAPPAGVDPALVGRVERYLIDTRTAVGQPQLAQALGVAPEPLARALSQLAADGKVTLVTDAERVPVVVRRG